MDVHVIPNFCIITKRDMDMNLGMDMNTYIDIVVDMDRDAGHQKYT